MADTRIVGKKKLTGRASGRVQLRRKKKKSKTPQQAQQPTTTTT